MRGDDDQQDGMFSYISPEKRVPADHPLRPIRKMVDEILKEMSPKFAKLWTGWRGRLPRGKAEEPDPRIHDGPRCPAVPEVQR